MTIFKNSSRVVFIMGLIFLAMGLFDNIMQRRDVMTYTFEFLGLLAIIVFSCLHNIEKRLTSIEQSLELKGHNT